MLRRFFIAAASSLCYPSWSAGLGASDFGHLDGYFVEPRTRALTLLLVIDRPLEDGLTKPKVRSKIRGYHQFVFGDPEFSKAHPEINFSATVTLQIRHPGAQNALGHSVLEQIVGYAKEMKFSPMLVVVKKEAKGGRAT